jgi:hypothetical protein
MACKQCKDAGLHRVGNLHLGLTDCHHSTRCRYPPLILGGETHLQTSEVSQIDSKRGMGLLDWEAVVRRCAGLATKSDKHARMTRHLCSLAWIIFCLKAASVLHDRRFGGG